ncbi:MAG: hypothetical protein C0594_06680, partial [Marinilabiliales bacterium]
MKTKFFFIIPLIVLAFNALSQNFEELEFQWKADLHHVNNSGYYNIMLTESILGLMNENQSDIRIFSDKGEEVPYIFETKKITEEKKFWNPLKILEKEYNKRRSYTRLVLQNPDKKQIRKLLFKIRNADVSKWMKISGSDSGDNWYVIKEKYYYKSIPSDQNLHEIRVIDLPLTNYEYFEIIIHDYFEDPIQIDKVYYVDYLKEMGDYMRINDFTFQQKDSIENKTSYIHIYFDTTRVVDKVGFSFSGADMYHRKADIFIPRTEFYKKKKEVRLVPLKSFYISSYSGNTCNLNSVRSNELILAVQNNDDKPLVLDSVKLFCLKRILTADLNKDRGYALYFGNSKVIKPQYDLIHFRDSITKPLETIVPLEAFRYVDKQTEESNSTMLIIWLALGFIGVLLLFMSSKMLS